MRVQQNTVSGDLKGRHVQEYALTPCVRAADSIGADDLLSLPLPLLLCVQKPATHNSTTVNGTSLSSRPPPISS